MPVNFQQIQRQVREMGAQTPAREQNLDERRQSALRQLELFANRIDALRQRIEAATQVNHNLRCAVPADELLNAHIPVPAVALPKVILAADGSQINPNRHDAVEFGVINVGIFRLEPGSGQAPREIVSSHLLSYDELNPPEGPIGEEIVALMRDLNEREALVEQARNEQGQVVTLTDGPLELFREPDQKTQYRLLLAEYLQTLDMLADQNVSTAGYVDRPRNDLVVRMLELTLLAESELPLAGQPEGRKLHYVTDVDVFTPLLQPGERSAIFGIQSITSRIFKGRKALHFFYINVGLPDMPALARVEIPAWVACDPGAVDLLHAALISQCRQLGARPYPYALHRAHEVAVVSMDEKEHLEAMIANELRRQGIWIGGVSNKQAHKDNSGVRTRYSR
jgi:hypothetical protein